MRLVMKMIRLHAVAYDKKPKGVDTLQFAGWTEAQPEWFNERQKGFLQLEDPAVGDHTAFCIETHFRINGKIFTPSFWVVPDEGEDATGVTVSFGLPGGGELQPMMEMPDSHGGFIDRPAGEYKVDGKTGKIHFKYANDAETGSLGTVQPGATDLYLLDKDGRRIGPARRLLVLPSSISKKEMDCMVDEILSIRRELVELDPARQAHARAALVGGARKTGSNVRQMIDRVEQYLDKIAPAMQRIDRRPRFHLKEHMKSVSPHRLRKVDARIVQQYVQNPARVKYTVPGAQRSTDIYEHRFIRNRLERLGRYLQERTKQSSSDRGGEQRNLCEAMKAEMGDRRPQGIRQQEVRMAWEPYYRKLCEDIERWKNDYRAAFDGIASSFQGTPGAMLPEGESFALRRGRNTTAIRLEDGRILYRIEAKRPKWKYNEIPKPFYMQLLAADGREQWNQKFFRCDIACTRPEMILLLVQTIEEALGGDRPGNPVLTLYGTWREKTVRVQVKKERYRHDPDPVVANVYERVLVVEALRAFCVNGTRYDAPLEDGRVLQELRERYAFQELSENHYDALLKHQTAEQLERRWKVTMEDVDASCKNVQEKIDALLQLDVLQKASQQDERWRMTQIFTNDPNYRLISRALRELEGVYDFTTGFGDMRLVHEKLDRLYEYWIFCRLLKKLVLDQHWTLVHHDTVVEAIRSFFTQPDGAPPARVELTHPIVYGFQQEGVLHMELFYEKHIEESLPDRLARVRDLDAYENVKNLYPDYLFRIRDEAGTIDQVFILDAKYRKYDEMGRRNGWRQEELEKTCAEKYITRLQNASHEAFDCIQAAFVVHTDATPGAPSQPNKFLGEYVTYDAAVDPRCTRDGKAYPEGKQVGGFYLVPETLDARGRVNASDWNLEAFFELMLEYDIGAWKTCWHCGSTDVEVKVLGTEGGFSKYHMTCRHCGAFWVKNHCGTKGHTVIKHLFNYFIEDQRRTWYVRCPVCDAIHPDFVDE